MRFRLETNRHGSRSCRADSPVRGTGYFTTSDLESEQRNAGVALALLSLIWGYNWVAMKTALADAGPLQFATLRFTLAALCMVPVIIKFRSPLLPRRQQWPAVALLGLMLAGNFACTLTALRLGGTGKTAVLVYTMPFWVLVFAWLALHERLDRLAPDCRHAPALKR